MKDICNIEISPAKPFPFNQSDIKNLNRKIARGEKSDFAGTLVIESFYPVDGCIPICHQGCTYWFWLVVTGELKGSVWDVANFVGSEGLWKPSGFVYDSYFSSKGKFVSQNFEDWLKT